MQIKKCPQSCHSGKRWIWLLETLSNTNPSKKLTVPTISGFTMGHIQLATRLLISEHALISEPPLFFEKSCHHYKRSLTCNDLRKYRFAPGIDADKVLKAKKKKKKKKKKEGGSLIRAIFWAQNYVSGQSAKIRYLEFMAVAKMFATT